MTSAKLVVVVILFVLGSVLATNALHAEQPYRIGYLHPGNPGTDTTKAFQKGLRDLGYVEGENIVIDYRFAKSNQALLPEMAADLVRKKVDVIVVCCQPAIDAAHKATRTIPIVVAIGADYVVQGFAQSRRHPGGNITGSASSYPALTGKMLQIFKETVPSLSRVAVLYHERHRSHPRNVKRIQEAAKQLDIEIVPVGVDGVDGFPAAFRQILAAEVDGVFVFRGGLLHRHKDRVTKFVREARLPSFFGHQQEAEAGGLIAYGTHTAALGRRAATYVDRILKGASPADLPIEGPTEFDFVVNLKTAETLGITIPSSILLQATKVIE